MAIKTILCLDLGTMCGFALVTAGAAGFHVISGVWDFRPGRFDGAGMRYVRFRKQLLDLMAQRVIDVVYFEEVRRHIGADAARVYGALFGQVTEVCQGRGIPYEGIPVGTIKKAWTGKGNSNKQSMIDEAHRRGYTHIKDDNEADAVALAHYVHGRDGDVDSTPVEPMRSEVLS